MIFKKPKVFNGMGNDPFVDAAESASFPLPRTGKREGGEKTQPLHRFSSHLGTYQGDPVRGSKQSLDLLILFNFRE